MRHMTLTTLISATPTVAKVLTTEVVLVVLNVLVALAAVALMVLLTVLNIDESISNLSASGFSLIILHQFQVSTVCIISHVTLTI